MSNCLSKSVWIMFLYDLLVLIFSTAYFYNLFNLDKAYFLITLILTVVTGLCTLFLKDNYKIREFNINFKNSYLLFEGCVFTSFPAAIFLFFFTPGIRMIAYYILANLIAIWFLLFIYRLIFHFYLFNFKRTKRVLIVGNGNNVQTVKNIILNKFALKMEVVSVYDDKDILSDGKQFDEVASSKMTVIKEICDEITSITEKEKIDIVIFTSLKQIKKKFSILGADYVKPKNISYYSFYDFYEKVLRKCYIDEYSVLEIREMFNRKKFYIYRFCKRVYDILAALIILTVTFPILLYIGLRVKHTDGGQVIYTQNRVTKGGKVFKAYKMRTMYVNNYKPTENNLETIENQNQDDRVIPFCKWVRKARFDEIPQMINILKGEMSIVGPRAEWEDLVKIYKNQIEFYSIREIEKTGWTGWAQINQGHCSSQDDIREKLGYDMYFIKNKNVLWEIGILIKAVFLALGGRHD